VAVAFDAIAPFEFGVVHRDIGILDQCGHVIAIIRVNADADAGADKQFAFVGQERLVETAQQFFGNHLRIVRVFKPRQQHDKFVTAKAGNRIDVAQLLRQAGRDALEQLVTHWMAEAVIDVLEAIKVQEQHGAVLIVASLVAENLAHPAFKQ